MDVQKRQLVLFSFLGTIAGAATTTPTTTSIILLFDTCRKKQMIVDTCKYFCTPNYYYKYL